MYKYSDLRSICANRLNAQKTIFEFVSMNHMMPFYTFQTTWNIAYWIILYSVCSFLICFRRFLISYSKKLYILWDVVFLYSILLDWVLLSLWWNSSLHETSVALSSTGMFPCNNSTGVSYRGNRFHWENYFRNLECGKGTGMTPLCTLRD